jgi:anti-sigma factor RsiW
VSCHLGDRVAALVDGELDDASRERALAHLAHCDTCRYETDAHRRLKATLVQVREAPPAPSADLTARLLALPAERPVLAAPPATRRSARRPVGAGRPTSRTATLRRPRRAATAGALLAVGLVGALALGGPSTSGPRTPVDPATPAFVAEYANSTSRVPLTEPVVATLVPAGLADPGR